MNRMQLNVWATLALLIFHGAGVNGGQPSLGFQSGVKLSWPTTTGATYRAQWSPGSPGAGSWTDFNAPIIGDALHCFEKATTTLA